MDAHAISSDLMNAMLSRLPERERRSLAEALARGAEAKEALLRWAGGAWTVDEVAAHLGISRQAVNKRRIVKAGLELDGFTGLDFDTPAGVGGWSGWSHGVGSFPGLEGSVRPALRRWRSR